MAALDALKGGELDADAVGLIRKSLRQPEQLSGAKAARLAEDNAMIDLLPDLLGSLRSLLQQC